MPGKSLFQHLKARPAHILPPAILLAILLFAIYLFTTPPQNFPSGILVRVSAGSSISQEAQILKNKHLIRSAFLFEAFSRIFGGRIIAGEYAFPEAQHVFTVAARLARADYQIKPVRVTIIEGATVKDITDELAQKVPDFDAAAFLRAAQSKEGYLFPDTYFILPGADVSQVFDALQQNFNERLSEPAVQKAIAAFGKPVADVITMASLLEKEAANSHDRRVIAGVLWHRIALGMPLQVDAVFPYILGKNSFTLTSSDLQVISPYNTYTHKGLPPGPIANPGLNSILAAVTPITTNYLFYLSDKQGIFHFCATYACHLANQKKYLGS